LTQEVEHEAPSSNPSFTTKKEKKAKQPWLTKWKAEIPQEESVEWIF
jgi:hypothetical protein